MAVEGPSLEQREQLAEAVKRAPSQPKEPEQLVYVWPHLVTIEFIAAILLMLSLTIMSWVVNAPLEGHANVDKTPNPSKAPWYFLNLQELLLHMHPALAGVLVPAGALTLIAMIPYFDRDQRDVGKWFGSPNASNIAWFTGFYTALVLPAEIFFDEFVGVKPSMKMLSEALGVPFLRDGVVTDIIVPLILLSVPLMLLLLIIYIKWKPSTREVMVCLFTGFVVSYVMLTVFGTFFRGRGMHLFFPWDPNQIRLE